MQPDRMGGDGSTNTMPSYAMHAHYEPPSPHDPPVLNTQAITCLVCYNAQVNLMLEPCRHQFHVQCIDRWLNKDKVCPVCWIPIQGHRPVVSQYPATASAASDVAASYGTTNGTANGSVATTGGAGGGEGAGGGGGGMLSGPAATSILPAQAAANMEHPNPPSMRKGKWTSEESAYCDRLIEEFKKGNLPLAEGTTLRTFLSKLLNCDPMRISKKYTGDQCIGKIIFRRREDELTKDEMDTIRRDLAELEKTYLEREQYNQRRREKRLESELSRDKNRFMAAARNAANAANGAPNNGANAGNSTPGTYNTASAMRPAPQQSSAAAMGVYSQAAATSQHPQLHPQHPQPMTPTSMGPPTPQQSQMQHAYQNQLASQQQRQQHMLAAAAHAHAQAQRSAQAHAQAQAQAQSLAPPPPRHPQQQQPPSQLMYNPPPPGRLPKDEFLSELPSSLQGLQGSVGVGGAVSVVASSEVNSLSMSRISSIDSFSCLFPRVESVDGFGSATNLASYASTSSTSTSAVTSDSMADHAGGGMMKSISIGDGLSAYLPRVQSLEHLSSLLQEHAPSSPRGSRQTIKDEPSNRTDDTHSSRPQNEDDPTAVQIRDADVSKRLSPNNGSLNKHSSLSDANQIQVPKPLSKMPRSSSGIFPRVPSMDKLPRVPSLDKLPRIPSMDKLPAFEMIPRAPSMGKLPRVPSLDKLSRVPSSSDMLSRFGSSDHLSSFPSFSNLTGLSSSTSYDKLNSLGGGGFHGLGAFRAGGFPRNSSIDDILSLVASSETGGNGMASNSSSLQLSALAAIAGEESSANDRKRRLEGFVNTTSGNGNAESSGDGKKSRVSA